MPTLSRPNESNLDADFVADAGGIIAPNVDDDIVIAEQDGDNFVFQDGAIDTSGMSEASSFVCSDEGETLFNPSLFLQRYHAVLSYLSTSSISSVLDTGCNNCRFLKFLQNIDDMRLIAGVDIDKGLLEEQSRFLAPLPADWLHGRKEEMLLEVWWGSVGDRESAKVMAGRVEAVTSIEIIEHLDEVTLLEFPESILGVIKPKLWIVTTPNREYNPLFPEWVGPFRHWDHRFEWTRDEFRDWAERVVQTFTEYTVDFSGVGFKDGCEESHGPCSQIAVFRRVGPVNVGENQSLVDTNWKNIARYTFPKKVDSRTREEKIHDEAIYYARLLANDIRERETVDGNVLVEVKDLLRFDGLKKFTEDSLEICNILELSGHIVDKEKVGVFIAEDPNGSEYSDEDYEHLENFVSDEIDNHEVEEWV